MPDLYRSLMTFGIIVLVGTVVFYLLALITLNINNPTSPALQSLIDVLKSLGTILGTALATIIAFYFGTRATESATEKAVAATAAATAAATGKADAAGEKGPPKVLDTSPADGATGVPLSSLISATFSHEMNSQTINENTFIVRKEGVPNPIKGNISLSPDRKTAIFDSEPDLEPNTKYTAEINEGAKDLAGNALVSAKRWSFTTITTT
jgi:cellobiose-specific phosphotransferase system component IIC